jgi:16S rRNA (cytosine1402-N4)-methyltransferase
MLPLPSEDVTMAGPVHAPVLLEESIGWLRPRRDGVYVDATLGPGGHAEAVLDRLSADGRLVGIDRDPRALELAGERLARFGTRFLPLHGDYRDLADLLRRAGVFAVDGVLADLGISSAQLDDPARGLSFRTDGPLDMRLDPTVQELTAADLLAQSGELELRRILRDYGEERLAGPIAKAIVRTRVVQPLRTTGQLRDLVERVAGPAARRYAIHPATRTFQALRIAVNDELSGLDTLVTSAASLLRRGGRLVIIAFHSLEDRAIKHAMRDLAQRCTCPPGLPVCGCGRENILTVLTPRAVRPGAREIAANPRARSARLRAAERLG